MKKMIIVLFIIIKTPLLYCQVLTDNIDSVIVKLNINDCNSCFMGLTLLDSYNLSNKVIVIKNNEQKYLKKILPNNFSKSKLIIISSDSIYSSLNTVDCSEVYIYSNNILYLHNKLHNFNNTNKVHTKIDTLLSISDTILISDDISINIDSGNISFIDKRLCSLTNIQPGNFFSIDISKYNLYDHFLKDKTIKDSIQIGARIVLSKLKAMNYQLVSISNSIRIHNSIYILSSISIPELNPQKSNSYNVKSHWAILKIDVTTKNIDTIISCENINDQNFNKRNYILSLIQTSNNSILIPYKDLNNLNIKFIEFKTSSMEIYETDYVAILPQFNKRNKLIHSYVNPISNFPYVIFPVGSEVVNATDTNQLIELPYQNTFTYDSNTFTNNKWVFYAINTFLYNNSMFILHYNVYYKIVVYTKLNLLTKKTEETIPLYIPDSIEPMSLTFFNKNTFIAKVRNNNTLLKLSLPNFN